MSNSSSSDPWRMDGPPPVGGDYDKGPRILGIAWAEAAMCIVAVAARFWDRSRKEDIYLQRQVLFLASASIISIQSSIGGYRHVYYLTEGQIIEALKINFIVRVPVYLSYASVKASIGAFILRIIRTRRRWQELVIWTTVIVTALVNIVACIMLFLQCTPVEVVWNPWGPGACWDKRIQTEFGIFVTAENILANIILSLIPTTFVFKLSLSLRKKIGLTILFSLSLIVIIASFMKVPALIALDSFYPDFTWGEYEVTIWSISETWVIVVCGSLPGMKPLLNRYLPKRFQESGFSSNQSRCRPDDYGLAHIQPVSVSINETRIEYDEPRHREPRMDLDERAIRATTQIDIHTEGAKTDEQVVKMNPTMTNVYNG
ncbi:hypothetical protein PHISCL_06293 [Aspergillus sclerotialis]|uniref:Rhodopsin domain-containing protein n=1 Tax=Aspergillus sclerotialis TaxID=2070753 RepID=A0A3A2ZWE7_9EURO|nr:hypothetical protein PHISCL_06293 [Aspergillus sclerotialis]